MPGYQASSPSNGYRWSHTLLFVAWFWPISSPKLLLPDKLKLYMLHVHILCIISCFTLIKLSWVSQMTAPWCLDNEMEQRRFQPRLWSTSRLPPVDVKLVVCCSCKTHTWNYSTEVGVTFSLFVLLFPLVSRRILMEYHVHICQVTSCCCSWGDAWQICDS